MATPLRSGQGHMGVGDSAEEFISIHALERERLLVLSCGLPSHPLEILFFARWETMASFWLSFLPTSRQTCFLEKPDRRPPQITGRRVSAVHPGGVRASSPRSEFTTLSLISSSEVCGEHETTPRLIQDLPEDLSSRCWPRSPRDMFFLPENCKIPKNEYTGLGP